MSRRDWAPEGLREVVAVRSGGVCECCGRARWRGLHHRRPRGMGGRSEASAAGITGAAWVVGLCGDGTQGCHGLVERERVLARVYGWLIAEGEDGDKPLVMRGMWGRLTEMGHVEWLPGAWHLPDPRAWEALRGPQGR